MEGLRECEANMVVYLHPSKAKSPTDAILRELSSLLFTYSETFDGVVLAYDPNVRSNLARILPGVHPYFEVKIKARLLLFNPEPDMLLEGEVVKITRNSIHAVVLGFSAAVIGVEDIREEFKHKTKRGEEVFVSLSYRKHKIKVGTILRFVVKSFDEEVLHISGSLTADKTGCAQWLDKNLDKWSQTESTSKKRKVTEGNEKPEGDVLRMNQKFIREDETPDEGTSMVNKPASLNKDQQIKRSKKRRKDHS
ncbi:hypothetical protein F511_30985 [Dorcoceras hygrometricum]|uniref:DNA-directed RNA polymerase subunit n=1 Tax=Dorcoceras hygrometricum TaxID=472368 RepID=A0A2Z7CB63_9LAMI|nr:hypothetical protein F511_30985 [Dorcoceras hygrometricum]